MLIEEYQENISAGYGLGSSGLYEPFTEDVGALFHALQREHGRCTSRVYVDGPAGEGIPIGWHFEKRARYGDTGEPYLLGTWVMLHEEEPTVTRAPHYRFLEG